MNSADKPNKTSYPSVKHDPSLDQYSDVDLFPEKTARAQELLKESKLPPELLTEEKSERNNTHLAGEYFVAAELYRRGFSVGMTIGNAKAIDLFASKSDKPKPLSIQVKAIKNKKSVGWPIMKDKVVDGVFYVFVNLNDRAEPEYYVATAAETREKVKQYATRGIIDLSTLKGDAFLNRWDKLEAAA